jgi:hypothetical protein
LVKIVSRNGRLLHVALCLAKLSSGTNQPNGEGLRGQPRTTLRRAIPSFTVEVRRRPRLATTSHPDVPSSVTKPPQAAFDRASDRARAAAFGASIDGSPVDVPSRPRGRILPSLVPDEPRHRLLEDAPVPATESERSSPAPKRPSVRALEQGAQASKSPRNSRFSSEEHVPLSAERPSTNPQLTSSMQSDEGAGATTRVPSQIVEDGLTLSANGRKRTIMARYVFGNEDKPGARWKRRLLRSR